MQKNRKPLIKPRAKAFKSQKGLCFYCHQKMWDKNPYKFCKKFKVSLNCAKQYRCTGEHLKSFSEGGVSSESNIVAACWFCNKTRHARKKVLSPKKYHSLVRNRLQKGKWNSQMLKV